MSHLAAALRHKRTRPRPHPSDRFTKKVLWARLQEAEDRNRRAASGAEDLRRWLRQEAWGRGGDRAEELAGLVRDILNDGRKEDGGLLSEAPPYRVTPIDEGHELTFVERVVSVVAADNIHDLWAFAEAGAVVLDLNRTVEISAKWAAWCALLSGYAHRLDASVPVVAKVCRWEVEEAIRNSARGYRARTSFERFTT